MRYRYSAADGLQTFNCICYSCNWLQFVNFVEDYDDDDDDG